jgi:hypothetical protein
MKSKLNRSDDGLANHEIVTLAVYLLGGEMRPIDTEHVSMKAAELAPGRFNWRLYPEQINIELVRVFLSAAKKQKFGNYLSGSGNEGWMLTDAGAIFAKQNRERLQNADLSRLRKTDAEKKWFNRERTRLLACEALIKAKSGNLANVTPREAANFFRLDEYVTGAVRARKIDRLVNAFRDDPDIGEVVLELRDLAAGGNSA